MYPENIKTCIFSNCIFFLIPRIQNIKNHVKKLWKVGNHIFTRDIDTKKSFGEYSHLSYGRNECGTFAAYDLIGHFI